jgi:hypothetical protein
MSPYYYDKAFYRQRHKVEHLSAGSRAAGVSPPATTDAPTPPSFSSICIAATVSFWL